MTFASFTGSDTAERTFDPTSATVSSTTCSDGLSVRIRF